MALELEEEALAARKANVRRFGATWLRPPGVTKTYQAMVDEAAERAEQESIAHREAALAEQQAAAEEEARRMRSVHGMDVDGEDDVEGMERDLDGEVPDADNVGGSDVEEDGHLPSDEEDGDDRDLDDDVPEAGAYEHTDTEAEDSTSDEEAGSPAQMAEEHITPESRGNATGNGGGGRGPTVVQSFRMPLPPPARGSGHSSSQADPDSSLLRSSPIAARPSRRTGQSTWAAARSRYEMRSRRDGGDASQRLTENRPSGL